MSSSAQAEMDVSGVVNNWIKKDEENPINPRIDDVVKNKDDQFYAVRSGGSGRSDVLVVHDKDKPNINKNNIGANDRAFFIEVKEGKESRTFSPTVKLVGGENGLHFEFIGT